MNKIIKAFLKASILLISLAVLVVGYTFMVLSAIEINGYLGILAIMSPLLAFSFISFYLQELDRENT
jgi:hypothetical protein